MSGFFGKDVNSVHSVHSYHLHYSSLKELDRYLADNRKCSVQQENNSKASVNLICIFLDPPAAFNLLRMMAPAT